VETWVNHHGVPWPKEGSRITNRRVVQQMNGINTHSFVGVNDIWVPEDVLYGIQGPSSAEAEVFKSWNNRLPRMNCKKQQCSADLVGISVMPMRLDLALSR